MIDKHPRDILAHKMADQCLGLFELFDKYIPAEHDVKSKFMRYVTTCEYLARSSIEQIEKDYLYDTEYSGKCLTTVTDEQMYSGYNEPNKELCPHTGCPKHNPDCWATYSLTPPGTYDHGDIPNE